MASVEPAHILRGHFGEVQSLSFLSEEHLYTGDSNGELRLWDIATCRAEFATRLHDTNAGILQLTCLPTYGVLVSQGRDGCVQLWAAGLTGALDRPDPLHQIRTHSFNFCRCAVWAPGEAAAGHPAAPELAPAAPPTGPLRDLRVACAEHDPADVGVWRPAEALTAAVHLRQPPSETKHGMCMSLAFLSPNASPAPPQTAAGQGVPVEPLRAATPGPGGAHDGADEGPDRAGGTSSCPEESRGEDSGCAGSSSGVGEATDPRFIVAGYEDGVVALWDLRSPGRPLGSLRLHGEPVLCLDVRAVEPARKGRGRERGRGGTPGASDCGGGRDAVQAPADGTESYDMVSGSADDQIACCVVRPAEAQPLGGVKQLRLREAGTADVRVRGDGKLFAAGGWDGRLRLYSLRRREPLAVLKYHRGQVTSVAFSPRTNTLASASRDTTVALWSVYSSPAPP